MSVRTSSAFLPQNEQKGVASPDVLVVSVVIFLGIGREMVIYPRDELLIRSFEGFSTIETRNLFIPMHHRDLGLQIERYVGLRAFIGPLNHLTCILYRFVFRHLRRTHDRVRAEWLA